FKCAISLVDLTSTQFGTRTGAIGQKPDPPRGQNPGYVSPPGQGITLLKNIPSYTSPEDTSSYTMPDTIGSVALDGRYTTIGLPEYTMPSVPSAPKKKGEVRREMVARPQERGVDDSFELIH